MPTLLDDPAAVEHDQLVHARDRAQPMRDHERGPAFHESPQRLLDKDFALRVQCAGRLVEQQDRRITQDRPGQRDSLLLPAGQLHATLADHRLESVWQGRRPPPRPIFWRGGGRYGTTWMTGAGTAPADRGKFR